MTFEWHDKTPIYKQLRELVIERVLEGSFVEGEAVPAFAERIRLLDLDIQVIIDKLTTSGGNK